jgi:hypothetical protein
MQEPWFLGTATTNFSTNGRGAGRFELTRR